MTDRIKLSTAIRQFLSDVEYEIDHRPTDVPQWVFRSYQSIREAVGIGSPWTDRLREWEELDQWENEGGSSTIS